MVTQYGLVIDLDRCTGCQTCTIACKMEHGLTGVSGIRVETVGGSHRDTPDGEYPTLSMSYLPVPCMHCGEPPCAASCPTDAIYKRDDGIVLIDEEKCNQCQACIKACPYDALAFDSPNSRVWKCNLCAHRVDQGLAPFCVSCCEMEAMLFGDIADPSAIALQWASQRNSYTLKPELGTQPSVRYCPPRLARGDEG